MQMLVSLLLSDDAVEKSMCEVAFRRPPFLRSHHLDGQGLHSVFLYSI